MKVNWDRLAGKIAGLIFAVVVVKLWLAKDDSWLEIVGDMIKGIVLWSW